MSADLHIDFEWRSGADIRLGPGAYFGAADSAPLCASYCVGTGPIRRWLPDEPCPPDIDAWANTGGTFVAHNAANFERHAVNRILVPRYGWPKIPVRQWRDTMAAARAMALPAALEPLAVALGLEEQKDKTGTALIKFFCIPRADGFYNEPADYPEKFAQFQSYCDQDVRTERAVDQRLVPLSADEQDAWVLCQTINDRGIRIDRPSALAALRLVDAAKAQADAAIKEATGGVASRVSDVTGLHTWLAAQGAPLDGLAKDDVLEALDAPDLPDNVRKVLKIRQAGAKTSTAKVAKFLTYSAASGKIENRMIYHGTSPGRWCLAEGSMIDVKLSDGSITQKPIEEVTVDDLVWDGDEWVHHEGVVESGEKKVIEHDGVIATPEHIVYIDNHIKLSLGEAKRRGLKIYAKPPLHNLRGDVS